MCNFSVDRRFQLLYVNTKVCGFWITWSEYVEFYKNHCTFLKAKNSACFTGLSTMLFPVTVPSQKEMKTKAVVFEQHNRAVQGVRPRSVPADLSRECPVPRGLTVSASSETVALRPPPPM